MTGFIKPHPPFEPPYGFERLVDPQGLDLPVRCDADRDPKDHFLLVQDRSKWRDLTADDKMQTIRSRYHGVVAHIDAEIKKIFDALDQSGQADDTLVILTADHGELLGDHYHYGKRSFFEAAARVPLIVRWPRKLSGAQRRDHLAVLQDVFTTVLNCCDVPVPEGVYGVNLYPAAADAEQSTRDAVVGGVRAAGVRRFPQAVRRPVPRRPGRRR